MKTLLAALLALPLLSLSAYAQEDVEDCKDSPTLSRMTGCVITDCSKKDFDQAQLRNGPNGDGETPTQSLEGEIEITQYACSAKISLLAIARNAEKALKAAGYSTVYSGAGDDEHPAFTAKKGALWVAVTTALSNGDSTYVQTVVHTKEMAQEMVANADAWEAEIAKSGECSIYGVLFDSGKASIQPASTACLTEMVKLLEKNSGWKMRVEGHTDNVGGKETNEKLSQQRAEAVRSWLIAKGIDGARLTAKGQGESKPVADNKTEDGRARNRRVTLVKL